MGIRLGRPLAARVRAGAIGVLATATVAGIGASAAPSGAATRAVDVDIAKAALLVVADFPAGFSSEASDDASHAENIRLAKGVPGCAPYIRLEKAVSATPHASSSDFRDDSRTVSNEVDVFKSEQAARNALVLYAKPSILGCLKKLFEKKLRQDPGLAGKIKSVAVTLERQDIAGLGDDSVVYEGKITLTGTNGSSDQIGIGNAAVRVGRAADVVSYSTTSGDLAEILTPAIDASVARLRTALGAQRS
jgi:hypothetical protein